MRLRVKEIVDIKVGIKDIKKLKHGYRVYKLVDGKTYCIRNSNNRKIHRTIEKLKAKIRELQSKKGYKNEYPKK